MSEAKAQILSSVRRAIGRDDDDAAANAAVAARLRNHPRNTIPARADLSPEGRVALFVEMAEKVAASVVRVPALVDVPDAVADYLTSQNLPAIVKVSPDPALQAIPWSKRPLISVDYGRADESDPASVTGAIAGVAETGTLLLSSGPQHPSTLNFLPDTHIAVLRTSQIVGAYEDSWDILRQAGPMPRTVNWITGPSRTGDIEQQIQLGAHGPRRLHIILVEGGASMDVGDA